MDLVVAHTRTDFDALASTIAASLLHDGAVPFLQSQLDARVASFVSVHRDELGLKRIDEVDLNDVHRVIVVDTRRPERLGDAAPLLKRHDVEWVVYDHHPIQDGDLLVPAGSSRRVGACVTLLIEALREKGCAISPIQATTMAIGIYADTGRFSYPGTCSDDLLAAAYLLQHGADLTLIQHYTEPQLSHKQRDLQEKLRACGVTVAQDEHDVFLASCSHETHVDGLALITELLQEETHADVIIIAVAMRPHVVNVVARSQLPALDLRQTLAFLNAKGHAGAVSALVRDQPLERIVIELRDALQRALPSTPRAMDMMSAPVRSIAPTQTLSQANLLLERLGHSALLVMDETGRLNGVLSKRDVAKGLRHGLAETPVSDWMTRRVVSIPPDCTLTDIERLMGRHDIGRMPVIKNSAVLGIVTRSDVLRIRYGHRLSGEQVVKKRVQPIKQRLLRQWREEDCQLLELVAGVSGMERVYLVGGAVRDLLLGHDNPDIDLVVEGSAIDLARRLTEVLAGAQLQIHEAVGTARIHLTGDRHLDVASARTEYYARPGAVPDIAFSSLKQDLARRDFTINCLAIQLSPPPFGQLLDFFDALQDLDDKQLRVLHNLSFVEDPSRVLRAVRFESQLGFRLEPGSEQLARTTLKNRQFAGFGSKRVMQELQRILCLPHPLQALDRLNDLGALSLIHPELTLASHTRRSLRLAHRLALTAKLDPSGSSALYLSVLLERLPSTAQKEALRSLQFSRTAWNRILAPIEALEEWSKGIPSASRIHRLLQRFDDWAILAVMVLGRSHPISPWLRHFRRDWRSKAVEHSGADLMRLGLTPGPRYAEILDALLEAKLTHPLPDKSAEKAWLDTFLKAETAARGEASRGRD